jgi:hypothetical protein
VLALRRESPRRYFERLAELIDLKASQFDTLVSELVQNHVTVDPTLVIMQSLYYGDDLSVLNQLEPNSAPPSVQATWGLDWQLANPVLKRDAGTKDLPYGKHLFARALEIVREFHRRGVRVAIGTDVGMPWITPGVSLHREMQLMVEAGIPPREVLLLATKNGAEGLKSAKKFGTIAPGMSADIVVLRADPTADIRNTRSIESVYREGRKFDPRALLSQLR